MEKLKFLFCKKYLILFIFIIITFACSKDHDNNEAFNNIVCNSYNVINDVVASSGGKDLNLRYGFIKTIYYAAEFLENDEDYTKLRYIINNKYFENIIPDDLEKVVNKTDTELMVVYKKYKKDIKKHLKKWLEENLKKEHHFFIPINLEKNYNNKKEIFCRNLGSIFYNKPDLDASKLVSFFTLDVATTYLPVIYLENLKKDNRGYFCTDRIPPEIAVKIGEEPNKWSFMVLSIKFKNFKKVDLGHGYQHILYVGRIFKVSIINLKTTSNSKEICEVIWEKDYK